MSKPTINSAIKDLGSFKDPRHFSGTMSEAHHFKRLLNVFKDYLKNDLGLEETNADYIEIINIDNDIQNAFDNLNNLRDDLKKNPSNQSLKDKVKNAIDDYNKKIQAKITILLKLQDKFEKRLQNAATNTSINKSNAQK